MYRQIAQGNRVVIRRVGGFVVRLHPFGEHAGVIRRVGGLEENKNGSEEWVRVIRRVGGLEETGGVL